MCSLMKQKGLLIEILIQHHRVISDKGISYDLPPRSILRYLPVVDLMAHLRRMSKIAIPSKL